MNKKPTPFPGGATSAAAPLWAALVALLNEKLGTRIGYINPLIYQSPKKNLAFNDIKEGDNDIANIGGYYAGTGWDACTGWGSPNGEELLKLFQGK
jgi:kumamolisin